MIALAIAVLAPALMTSPAPMPHIEMIVEGRGSIVLEIRKDQAPNLAAHFLELVDEKFYDNLLFHRKVDHFVIQSGDPASRGKDPAWARKNPGENGGTKWLGEGGSGKPVRYEVNDLVHDQYTIGMALESPMDDSGDSQFFINLEDNHRLNGLYEVFGKVVKGFDVVNSVQRGDRITKIRRTKAPL